MRIVGVRDWRCLVLAVTTPVVVHGLYYGNVTVLLLVPLALAWRYRDRAAIAGVSVGLAIAAKLFVWPLVVWLLLTRRFRAAAWALGSSIALLLGAWAVIGFEGLRDYPALLRAVQDVYAVRSVSVSTVAGAVGVPVGAAVAVATATGIACIAVAAWLVRGENGDRRSFAGLVAASILASSIVWPNYLALLLVPVAITWPRFAPIWLFGYVAWLAGAIAPKPVGEDVCCRPADVPVQAWERSHVESTIWLAAAPMSLVVLVSIFTVRADRARDRWTG